MFCFIITLPKPSLLKSATVVSRARKTLRVSTTELLIQTAQITEFDVSSKEGAVIGAVLSTRKFHRGHH
jgi:hypothetical protein